MKFGAPRPGTLFCVRLDLENIFCICVQFIHIFLSTVSSNIQLIHNYRVSIFIKYQLIHSYLAISEFFGRQSPSKAYTGFGQADSREILWGTHGNWNFVGQFKCWTLFGEILLGRLIMNYYKISKICSGQSLPWFLKLSYNRNSIAKTQIIRFSKFPTQNMKWNTEYKRKQWTYYLFLRVGGDN